MELNLSKKPFRILIADDDQEDIEFARNSFEENNLDVLINEVGDGQNLIDLLKVERKAMSEELPQLILLDLNMPGKHGFEALKEIKEDRRLCKIPVVIFSTSSSPKDIQKAYELGANCYVTKPHTVKDWSKTIGHLGRFWIQCVTLSL